MIKNNRKNFKNQNQNKITDLLVREYCGHTFYCANQNIYHSLNKTAMQLKKPLDQEDKSPNYCGTLKQNVLSINRKSPEKHYYQIDHFSRNTDFQFLSDLI